MHTFNYITLIMPMPNIYHYTGTIHSHKSESKLTVQICYIYNSEKANQSDDNRLYGIAHKVTEDVT